jgi:hypothetical protein
MATSIRLHDAVFRADSEHPTEKRSDFLTGDPLTGDPLWRQARTSATFPLVAALTNLLGCGKI